MPTLCLPFLEETGPPYIENCLCDLFRVHERAFCKNFVPCGLIPTNIHGIVYSVEQTGYGFRSDLLLKAYPLHSYIF